MKHTVTTCGSFYASGPPTEITKHSKPPQTAGLTSFCGDSRYDAATTLPSHLPVGRDEADGPLPSKYDTHSTYVCIRRKKKEESPRRHWNSSVSSPLSASRKPRTFCIAFGSQRTSTWPILSALHKIYEGKRYPFLLAKFLQG